jgi:hypothetical protein
MAATWLAPITQTRRTTMLRKIILGAAAAVALGASILSPNVAEAKPWKYHHHFHPHASIFYGSYGAYGMGGGCYVKRWVPTPFGMRLRWVNRCAY